MTGAEAVLRTLAAAGVRACFANPGTSEMHLVTALDGVPEVRPVLALFEGVAAGAADGYGRMTGEPAATLLHLGPGLGNAVANLHNAYKARTPLVNLVGDHAVLHRPLGAPLTSDVEAVARPVSHWLDSARDARSAPTAAAAAVAAARGRGGGVATLVLPADAGWEQSPGPVAPVSPSSRAPVPAGAVEAAAVALRGARNGAIVLGGHATGEPGLRAAAATGARLLHDRFPPRLERGAGRPAVPPVPYLTDMALAALADVDVLVCAGAPPPVGFFAYPNLPSHPVGPDTDVHVLAGPQEDAVAALEELAEALGRPGRSAPDPPRPAPPPEGPLDVFTFGAAVAAALPEGAIVVDEAVTGAEPTLTACAGAPPHDWLFLSGGAIGWGLPAATGAAVACPDRPVLCLEADGSAMYTLQSLWTQAREGLDVTTVILANRSYAILEFEMRRVGAAVGAAARELFDLDRPPLDFVALAGGMGVPGRRVQDTAELGAALREALAEPGPHLIEAVISSPS
ncbi:MAG TPA: acetolactate synthase large subunit [Solirubrobacteraceae bacterium]|jgi:acetolactate synthase-1/2/3 large subunit